MRIVIPVLTRVLSALCALALLALGALIVIELVSNWTGNGFVILPSDWPSQLRATSWDATIVRNSLLITLVVGIVLLVISLWKRPPLTVDSSEVGVRIERRSIETALRRRLDALDGVNGCKVRVDRKRIHAAVDTSRKMTSDSVREAVVNELRGFCALHDLQLAPDVSVKTDGGSR